jgi:uncharacterized lipoprotein YddW (UPF0748 family)
MRAVWITTAASLDWPRSQDREEQRASLRRMVHELSAAHFNTVFFQVRARGDAYYTSRYEPWAENLTGTLGRDPGWDPLEELLDEAHAYGMDVHAWFNAFKVRGPSPVPPSVPPHPARSFPQWIHDDGGEGWLDPGVPAVREYLVNVALDLIQRYDIDGLNLDFARYPGRAFADDPSYRQYGNGMDRDDWRRQNINRFVGELAHRARTLKPALRMGSSPIGLPGDDSATGLSGAPRVFFQDAPAWMAAGIQDYVVPQVYWDIGASRGDPDYSSVLAQWVRTAGACPVVAGIGAYKPAIAAEVVQQIDVARRLGAVGQSYFRYENIRGRGLTDARYPCIALPPPLGVRDTVAPVAPSVLAVSEHGPGVFLLEWTPAVPAADGDAPFRYVVYRGTTRMPALNDPRSIVAVLPASATFLTDSIASPSAPTYYYAITTLDRAGNESPATTPAPATIQEILALGRKVRQVTALSTALDARSRTPSLAAYILPDAGPVRLDVRAFRKGTADSVVATIVRADQTAGMYVVGLGRFPVVPGAYLLRLEANGTVVEQALTIAP